MPVSLEHTNPTCKEGRGLDYKPVQDLRLVKQAAVTLYPTVSNPYNLLSLLSPSAKIYTCLDLKDAFFFFFGSALLQYLSPFLPLNGKI